MRRLPAGPLFLAAIVALCAIAAADLQLTKASFRETRNYDERLVGPERTVLAHSVEVRPGDRLYVHQHVPGVSPRIFESYDFYIVASGDRHALFRGEELTRPAYHSVHGIDPEPCCSGQLVVFDRPRSDTASFAPGLAEEPLTAHLARPDLLDVVWVLHYAEGVELPADEEGRLAFDRALRDDLNSAPGLRLRDPVVFEEPIVRLRPMFVFATEMAALVAVLAAGVWVVQLRRAGGTENASGTEDLLRLHAAAGDFLSRVRDLIVGVLATAFLAVLHAMFRFESQKRIGSAEELLAAYSPGFVGDPVLIVYLALLVAALGALWRTQRALVRWRRRAADLPSLDL